MRGLQGTVSSILTRMRVFFSGSSIVVHQYAASMYVGKHLNQIETRIHVFAF